jgi:hypothetical protein
VAERFQLSGKPTPFPGSGPHSTPRWRTRGLRSDASLPSARRELFWDLPGRPTSPCPGEQPEPISCWPGAPTFPSFRHRDGHVLAEPSNNSKKHRAGQRFRPLEAKIIGTLPYPGKSTVPGSGSEDAGRSPTWLARIHRPAPSFRRNLHSEPRPPAAWNLRKELLLLDSSAKPLPAEFSVDTPAVSPYARYHVD